MNLRNRFATALIGATFFASSLVGVANAYNASVVIGEGGTLSATIDSVSLSGVTFNYAASTTSTGTMRVSANDPRGTYEGWTVDVTVGDFQADGKPSIAKNNFQGTNVPTVATNSGQTWAGSYAGSGPVDSGLWKGAPSSFASGIPTTGSTGNYTATLPVKLTVPAGQPVGTYTSNMTVSITSGN